MRIRTINTLALAAALSAAAPALQAQEKPAGPPKPAPEMSQLEYFAGTWACTGKAFQTPMSQEHATEATVHSTLGLGGFWHLMHYDEKKTAANATPIHVAMFLGYDAGAKAFVLVGADSFGGSYWETSKGWAGDAFVLEGPAGGMGPNTRARDTFTKKSATELTHSGELQGPDGKWMKLDEETCKKSAAKK
ncbi:MAG: DUF1579 family protein [Acidithiobacillales bacterium]